MSSAVSIANATWLADPQLQKLLAVLSADGEAARIAGGAVRNTLIGQDVTDIDIATTNLPDRTMSRAAKAGFKTAPTGIEHGTVTIIAEGRPFEVTTLRSDVETDGRRAKVKFGRDWLQDAERRDFTINALYAEADGTVIDLVGGVADIESQTLRFIGDPEARIREDYLRILRFFRFFAWYGSGRPDAEGLKACSRLKHGLSQLSAERVWGESKKLLSAPDPSRALLWMRQTGVLTAILPESEKWGIDAIPGLIAAERDLGWKPDPLLRLAAIVPPDAERLEAMGRRLRFANAETERLVGWAGTLGLAPDTSGAALFKLAYRHGKPALRDRLRLSLAGARVRAADDDKALVAAGGYSRLLGELEGWERPVFPIGGRDLATLGVAPGKAMGDMLKLLETEWVESGFRLDRGTLVERASGLAGPKS
jgi:poly(A) polymerase